jgi:hypothetical protein
LATVKQAIESATNEILEEIELIQALKMALPENEEDLELAEAMKLYLYSLSYFSTKWFYKKSFG